MLESNFLGEDPGRMRACGSWRRKPARPAMQSGVAHDIRWEERTHPEDLDFKSRWRRRGLLSRYRVRMVEFRESIKIVRQALKG
jgi:Ni,Fe-hydrogenase III large subunit